MLRTLILAIGLAASLCALAQGRIIPAEAKRGQLQHVQADTIRMSGKLMRLSPAAQIRDASNLIVQPTAVPAGTLVRYTLDVHGYVHRVWILTLQEASQPDNVR
jgi:hypothetical protein